MLDRQGARPSRVIRVFVVAALVAAGFAAVAGAASNGKRLEGRWTIANWEVSRTPANADYVPGTAGLAAMSFSPRCGSGRCAVRVRPAGQKGTYVAVGGAVTKDADKKAYRLTWDGTKAVYTAHRDLGLNSCTTADGAGGTTTVANGYSTTRDVSYTFHKATRGKSASVTGQRITTATGTPEGVPQGCTDYSVTAKVAGAPTGSVKVSASGAAGQYRVTEVVDRTEGSGQRPRGFSGILIQDSTVTAKGRGLTITGIVGTATLRPTRVGWTGTTRATQPSCKPGSTAPGFTATESWIGLRPVARTESGAPVLSGTWRYAAEPTASGVADGCSFVSNRGQVILVPTSAITP